MQDYNSKLKVDKAKDIKQKTYTFALAIVCFCKDNSNSFVNEILLKQLLRCGTSIGANLIESQAASSKRDFIKYLEISLKSANETKFWICIIRDSNIGNSETINDLLDQAITISNILAKIIMSSKNKTKF